MDSAKNTNTVTLHRVIKARPDKLFRAFTHEAAIASWLPPYGFVCSVQHMEAKLGGTYHMSFENFSTGNRHGFSGRFVQWEPGKLLQFVETFDDPAFGGEMTTTVELAAVSCGTEMHIRQTGIPAVIPVEMCYLGWQESLEKLIALVEPVIPEG